MPLYLASKKEFHLFPDWYAVSQTNYQGAHNCWGRCPEKVSENMEKWRAKFSIIYQESGSDLENKWLSHYELISTFDWKEYLPSLRGVRMWNQTLNTPKWFLLKSITHTAHKA